MLLSIKFYLYGTTENMVNIFYKNYTAFYKENFLLFQEILVKSKKVERNSWNDKVFLTVQENSDFKCVCAMYFWSCQKSNLGIWIS